MNCAILWFRRDLRLTDNPALRAALANCERLIPLYIHAPEEADPWSPGGASRWWLHHSLVELDAQLKRLGSRLIVARGASQRTLETLARRHAVTHLCWNRLHEPALAERDAAIMRRMAAQGIDCRAFNGALLLDPREIANKSGQPFRVFTPFWRACLQQPGLREPPLPRPRRLPPVPDTVSGLRIDELALLPRIAWDGGLAARWQPGERGALKRLRRFVNERLEDYHDGREVPGIDGTSALSPHLHFGEIGPRQILHAVGAPAQRITQPGAEAYLRELGWREFAHHLLHHFPHTPQAPLDPRFEAYPWAWGEQQPALLEAWRRGRTGIPIVDAGMRELWHSGWMHNRVRMIVASLLTKNLGIHWLEGARWFWDTLVDADLANNTLGWQWTAGCGADAAPFFRVFNPVRQGERFDPRGEYVRRWVPELAQLPDARIHAPWLTDAGIDPGTDYPRPIVDLGRSRRLALSQWNRIK
jgi:deoxyribodipyrimidine photo-lyase